MKSAIEIKSDSSEAQNAVDTIDALANCIANGEQIDLTSIPEAIRETPKIKKLLALARVTLAFKKNFETKIISADVIETNIGPWRLLRQIGLGGMGEVWLGERIDGTVEQRVAIKRVRIHNDRFRDRLHAERQILAKLSHPNIAHFVDAGIDANGSPWLALEYIDGVSITDWCQQQRLSVIARLKLFQQVCAAVEHAHRHLIVHRDLKPNNILVNAQGQIKLLDFGIAKLLDGHAHEHTIGALTPSYAAPEQLRNEMTTTATDVYVLGLLLYRILADTLPDSRNTDQTNLMRAKIEKEEAQKPSKSAEKNPNLPYPSSKLIGDLDAIVSQAMRCKTHERYGSVAEFSADISRYLTAQPVRARTPSTWYFLSRFIQRNAIAVAFATLAFSAIIIGAALSLHQARRAAIEAQSAHRELARAERVTDFLSSLYREQDPMSRAGAASKSPGVLIAEAVTRVETELNHDPIGQARLLRVLGEAQYNISELLAARTTLDSAAKKATAHKRELLLAEIEGLRGAVAAAELRMQDSERFFDRALSLASKNASTNSIEVARINTLAAVTFMIVSRHDDARRAAESSVQVLSKILGENHPEAIKAFVAFALMQEHLRDDINATKSVAMAIRRVEQKYSANDARLIRLLVASSKLHSRTRQISEARLDLHRAEKIARQTLGERSRHLGDVLIKLSDLESTVNNFSPALIALNAAEQALPESPSASRAQLHINRGQLFLQMQEGKKAERDFREARRLGFELGGASNYIAWINQVQLGEALALQNQFENAHILQAQAEQKLLALLGPEAYAMALASVGRAETFLRQKDWPNAAKYFRESIRIGENKNGRDNVEYFSWNLSLAQALSQLQPHQDEAIAIADNLIKNWHRNPDQKSEYVELVLLRCDLYRLRQQHQAAKILATQTLAKSDVMASKVERDNLTKFATWK